MVVLGGDAVSYERGIPVFTPPYEIPVSLGISCRRVVRNVVNFRDDRLLPFVKL